MRTLLLTVRRVLRFLRRLRWRERKKLVLPAWPTPRSGGKLRRWEPSEN